VLAIEREPQRLKLDPVYAVCGTAKARDLPNLSEEKEGGRCKVNCNAPPGKKICA
jgi:hypothetical protein